MKKKKELLEYIFNSTGWEFETKTISATLPLYLKAGYELWGAKAGNLDVVFAKVKNPNTDIRVHQNASSQLQKLTSHHIVLVFDRLDTRSAASLIRRNIPFVVQDQQIYMPFALMSIETKEEKRKTHLVRASMNSDADTILIGYLSNKIYSEMMIKEIAQIIGRENRATSQALDILGALGYVEMRKAGRSKIAYFIPQREAFERLKKESKSPIKYIVFMREFAGDKIYSGRSALSSYSSVIDEKTETVALSHKRFISEQLEEYVCEEYEAKYKAQIWDREPAIFAENGVICPLYVVRFFLDDQDERVQEAVEMIEKNIVEKLGNRDESN